MLSSANDTSISGTFEISMNESSPMDEPAPRPSRTSPDPGETARLPVFERPIGYDLLIARG